MSWTIGWLADAIWAMKFVGRQPRQVGVGPEHPHAVDLVVVGHVGVVQREHDHLVALTGPGPGSARRRGRRGRRPRAAGTPNSPSGSASRRDGSRPGRSPTFRASTVSDVFTPTLGEVDLYLFGEGRHRRLWEVLGAHPRAARGRGRGSSFSVWAPNARAVRVVGDWNGWDGRVDPLRPLGVVGRLGAVRARGRSGPALQVRARRRRRAAAAEGRPDGPCSASCRRPPRRVVAGVDPRVGRRRVDGPPARPQRRSSRSGLGSSRSHLGSWRPGLSYREAARRSWPTTWPTSASPTSSCCRSPSTPSAARGATR